MDLHMACLANSCQGKDAEVLFGLHYSIHQHTGFGCYKFLTVGTIFDFAKVNRSLHASWHSLFWTANRRMDSLACVERTTDAYS